MCVDNIDYRMLSSQTTECLFTLHHTGFLTFPFQLCSYKFSKMGMHPSGLSKILAYPVLSHYLFGNLRQPINPPAFVY